MRARVAHDVNQNQNSIEDEMKYSNSFREAENKE
jgi:hypothetical protein